MKNLKRFIWREKRRRQEEAAAKREAERQEYLREKAEPVKEQKPVKPVETPKEINLCKEWLQTHS